jgi:ubiquinone/menaquinone biosynthesis C-methylase UbiE
VSITVLPRVVASPAERPTAGNDDHPMRKVTRQIAFEAGGWTAERKAKVTELFDGLAPGWDARITAAETRTALLDALGRGGELPGPCIEVGAGTGRATGPLLERFGAVLAVDVSLEMLRRFNEPAATVVLADGGQLPVPDASAGTVVLVNAFLFPHEIDRVLAPGGAVVWVNTLAEHTPIHQPVADVVAALPGEWTAVTAEAGWGLWATVRRCGTAETGEER